VCTALASRISRLITTDPGWPWPGRFVGLSGIPVTALPVYTAQQGYRLRAEQLAEVIEPGSLIYLIDPLNPLGSSYGRDELALIAALARETGSLIVHDCTYRHFATGHSLVAELYPEGTITTYSFSKWLGLAGLRVGAVVGPPSLLQTLTSVPANPLGASIQAQRAAIAGLEVKGPWLERLRAVNAANQETVGAAVAASGLGRVLVRPSHGNFLAVDVSGIDVGDIDVGGGNVSAIDVGGNDVGDAGVRDPEASTGGWTADGLCAAMLEHDVFIRSGTYQSPLFGTRFVKVSTSVPEPWAQRFAAAWSAVAREEPR
jgi:aspartate/methionine/tyrosine aminotransferase